jgi:hypothetical protein
VRAYVCGPVWARVGCGPCAARCGVVCPCVWASAPWPLAPLPCPCRDGPTWCRCVGRGVSVGVARSVGGMLEHVAMRTGAGYVDVGVAWCRPLGVDDDGADRYVVCLVDGRRSLVSLLGWAPGVVVSMTPPVLVSSRT